MRHLLGPLAIAGMLVVACGNDDDAVVGAGSGEPGAESAADADAYVRAAVADWTSDRPNEVLLGEDMAVCMATAMVDLVGVDGLRAAGVTPEQFAVAGTVDDLGVELPDGAADELADALTGCGLAEILIDSIVQMLGDDPEEDELPPGMATCVAGTIDDRGAAVAWAADFVDGTATVVALVPDAIAACPEVATAVLLSGAPGTASPEAEACALTFVETHPDLVEAWLDDEPDAATTLANLLLQACPTLPT